MIAAYWTRAKWGPICFHLHVVRPLQVGGASHSVALAREMHQKLADLQVSKVAWISMGSSLSSAIWHTLFQLPQTRNHANIYKVQIDAYVEAGLHSRGSPWRAVRQPRARWAGVSTHVAPSGVQPSGVQAAQCAAHAG